MRSNLLNKQASEQAGRQAGKQAGRQAGRQAGKQASRQAGRQAGKISKKRDRPKSKAGKPAKRPRGQEATTQPSNPPIQQTNKPTQRQATKDQRKMPPAPFKSIRHKEMPRLAEPPPSTGWCRGFAGLGANPKEWRVTHRTDFWDPMTHDYFCHKGGSEPGKGLALCN